MSRLKVENVKKCISLLRGYLDQTPPDQQKGAALLALDQLQRISAGDNISGGYSEFVCLDKPRAQGDPSGG